jgi:hypothetical protein
MSECGHKKTEALLYLSYGRERMPWGHITTDYNDAAERGSALPLRGVLEEVVYSANDRRERNKVRVGKTCRLQQSLHLTHCILSTTGQIQRTQFVRKAGILEVRLQRQDIIYILNLGISLGSDREHVANCLDKRLPLHRCSLAALQVLCRSVVTHTCLETKKSLPSAFHERHDASELNINSMLRLVKPLLDSFKLKFNGLHVLKCKL